MCCHVSFFFRACMGFCYVTESDVFLFVLHTVVLESYANAPLQSLSKQLKLNETKLRYTILETDKKETHTRIYYKNHQLFVFNILILLIH